MAGYSISLYKIMRIDEDEEKRNILLGDHTHSEQNDSDHHSKFLAYGEFDRISFDRIDRFSRYRDISMYARNWIGDRQVHFVFELPGIEDEICLNDKNFFIKEDGKDMQSSQLFVGLTLLQMKDSQRQLCSDMLAYLGKCKENILKLVKEKCEDKTVKCAVFGTLGSFGLTILWLADQYVEVLKLVTHIRNRDVSVSADEKKSIFLSAYTIFAQNHKSGENWKSKRDKIEGEAIVRLTLKRGITEEIKSQLCDWDLRRKVDHCVGEHDIVLRMKSSTAFSMFGDDKELKYDSDFYKAYILQTNVQFCEVIGGKDELESLKSIDSKEISGKNEGLQEYNEINKAYGKLRKSFITEFKFPSSTGMVDTLDLLYSDYISKISSASNEMWLDNFSHQFYSVLKCIKGPCCDLLRAKALLNKEGLKCINDLLIDFERQISHIAESNNLIYGTPVCQYRYSGQNNLTLYAYFGIMKDILGFVYEHQDVSVQDELVPLIVADIVPIIESELYIEYRSENKQNPNSFSDDYSSKIVTFTLPMVALYHPIGYYPYLYHEIYHYVVPRDRHVRNEYMGIIFSTKLLMSALKTMCWEYKIGNMEGYPLLDLFFEGYMLKYVYSFVLKHYQKYIGSAVEHLDKKKMNYGELNQSVYSYDRYEEKLVHTWTEWLGIQQDGLIEDNPLYLCINNLYKNREEIKGDFKIYYSELMQAKEAEKAEQKLINFLDSLAGIVEEVPEQVRRDNINGLADRLDTKVWIDAHDFIDNMKEGLADTAMVSNCELDFTEYWLLFAKIKKDLLFSNEQVSENNEQDVIRIGMVTYYILSSKFEGEDYEDKIKNRKRDFDSLFCGLYYGRKNEETIGQLKDSADKWFTYFYQCYVCFMQKYTLFLPLFFKLQENMILYHSDGSENTGNVETIMRDNVLWKKYINSVQNFGTMVTEQVDRSRMDKDVLGEKRKLMDKDVFEINLKFISQNQNQQGFKTLDDIRISRIESKKKENYIDKFDADELLFLKDNRIVDAPKAFYWQMEAGTVSRLSKVIADIAGNLENSCRKIFGNGEYFVWYRGQESEKYKLLPSIMRSFKEKKENSANPDNFYLLRYLKERYEEFKFRADGAVEAIDRTGYTDADYIALMQHYSVKSNFLDWTEDALSALYFALEGFFDESVEIKNENAALYIFSPDLYNYAVNQMIMEETKKDGNRLEVEKQIYEALSNKVGIPNLSVDYNKEKYFMYLLGKPGFDGVNKAFYKTEWQMKRFYYLPLAVYVPRLNRRIRAQNGLFTVYNVYTIPEEDDGFDYVSIEAIQSIYLEKYEKYENVVPFLYKLIIPRSCRKEVSKWVKAFGMSKEKCYPELSSIGERIMK